jgi:uncharacterized protein YdhG (YjbR/CyaY superfamily)
MNTRPVTIEDYIASFPPDIQETLQNIRATINRAAPGAEEAIRYGIPTFRLDGTNLVHFAAFKDHISFFPTPSAIAFFRDALSGYRLSKGTIQIPLNTPVPYDLIERITRFRAAEVKKDGKKKKA